MAFQSNVFWGSGESSPWLKKLGLLLGSGAAFSAVVYTVYRYYRREDRDEGFVDVPKTQEPSEVKVLVLGLDGTGKSCLLQCLSGSAEPLRHHAGDKSTVVNLNSSKNSLTLWEVDGSPSSRKNWSSFVQDTHILVYVVDSSDEKRLPESFSELHRILGDERLLHVPIVIVANKQDLPGALDRDSILTALAMDFTNRQRRHVDYVATEVPPNGKPVGISELKTLLEHLASHR